MMGFSHSFLVCYVLALALGTYLTESVNSSANIGISLFCFLLSWTLHYFLFRVDYMRSDVSTSSKLPGYDQKIFFKGSELDTFEHEHRERDFLSIVAGPKRQIFYRLAYVVLACVFVLLMSKEPKASFTFTSVLQLLAGFALIPICSVNHWMLPQLLSAFAVILHVMKNAGTPLGLSVPLLAIWLGLWVVTLALHRAHVRNVSALIEPRLKFDYEIRQGLRATALLLALIFFFHWVIPQKLQSPKLPDEALVKVAEKMNSAAGQLISKVAGQQRTEVMESRSGATGPGSKSGAKGSASNHSGSGVPGTGGAQKNGQGGAKSDSEQVVENLEQKLSQSDKNLLRYMKDQGKLRSLPRGQEEKESSQYAQASGGEGKNGGPQAAGNEADEPNPQELTKQLGELEKMAKKQVEQKGSGPAGETMTDANKAELEGALKEELEQAKKQLDSEQIKKIVDYQSAKDGQTGGAAGEAGHSEGAGGVTRAGAMAGTGAVAHRAGTNEPNERARQESAESDAEKFTHKVAETPQEKPAIEKKLLNDEQLKMFVRMLKFALMIAGVALFLKIILPYTQKPKPLEEEKPQRAGKQKRKLIYGQLQDLARVTLTPEQEIVKKYHIFLETMSSVELGKHPSLPPTHYLEQLNKDLPSLSKDFSTITFAFCDVLYGERSPQAETLQRYRASFDRVLGQFL